MVAARTARRRLLWRVVLGVGVLGVLIGLVVFKPWLLFVDVRVDEQLPSAAAPASQAQPSPSLSAPGTSGPAAPEVPVSPVQ